MRYLIVLFLTLTSLFAIDITSDNNLSKNSIRESLILSDKVHKKPFFGEELFKGNFKENRQYNQNSDYILNVNDKVSVKMWGAHNYMDNNLTIDKQGNIFLPEVGAIYLLGLSSSQLQSTIENHVRKVFNDNVHVYADIQNYQPISVYVAGSVKKIGLYEGLSSDSILQFIDKAGGILRGIGSYRNITLLRNKEIIASIDLYDFLLTGNIDAIQFKNGDTIVVHSLENYITVEGEVERPYNFELLTKTINVANIIPYVLPLPKANSFTITHWKSTEKSNQEFSLDSAQKTVVENGDVISFLSNYYLSSINLSIEGEHKSKHHVSIKKGTTLYIVLSNLEFTDLSDIRHIKVYKKRVAKVQKALIESKLKELEQSVLTTDSASEEEAKIRESETSRVLEFIRKARKVEPKGQLILELKSDLRKIILEEGDLVVVPSKSSFIVVEGEVSIPNALIYEKGKNIFDYIDACGGFTDRADESKILLIKANGKVLIENTIDNVEAGDSILVLRKVDTKNTIWVKNITQILYQIAVGAAVALQF